MMMKRLLIQAYPCVLFAFYGAEFVSAFVMSPTSCLRSPLHPSTARSSASSQLISCHMIQNLFGSNSASSASANASGISNSSTQPQLPRDVKEAVRQCREATQSALSDRISRMTVDFPVGTKFGVEKLGGSNKKKRSATSSSRESTTTPTLHDLQKSDRELARIFVEMFQPVGGEHLVVAFNTLEEADAAREQWKGDPSASSRILSMDRRRQQQRGKSSAAPKKNKAKGFAAKLAAEINDDSDDSFSGSSSGSPFQLPEGTEVALFVAPGPREFVVIERICNQAGMGTLVVLLNARLSSYTNFGSPASRQLFQQEFITVFSLGAAPQDAAPGCLLYRSYHRGKSSNGGDWILARKPAVGPPKTILVQLTCPTSDQCRLAMEGLELSELEKNVETAMENVAGWLR